MAILIVEHKGAVEGASLSGRILIGRRSSNHVVVDDPAVSRIHAWIDTAGQQFCLTDAGSRTGTFVNGQRVANRRSLHHGDRITVGPATLIFRGDGSLPAGISHLNFGDRPAAQADGGILFDCTCGAPLWISSAYAGRMGKCRFCGAVVQVPNRAGAAVTSDLTAQRSFSPQTPSALEVALAPTDACGICQAPIAVGESSTACPDCGLTFHADCWTENFGCAAYGCSQVNVLLPPPEQSAESTNPLASSTAVSHTPADAAYEPKIPAQYALLASSVAGLLLGLPTFGVPALAALVASLVYLRRHRGQRTHRVVLAAALLATLGILAGVAVSYVLWLADTAPTGDGIGVWREDA